MIRKFILKVFLINKYSNSKISFLFINLQFQCQLIHNLSLIRPNFHVLKKIILIPYLLQHTNVQMLFLHTLNQIYDRFLKIPMQQMLNLLSYKQLSYFYQDHFLELLLVVDNLFLL